MKHVQEGVSNFRAFQERASAFFTAAETTEKLTEKRHRANTTRLNTIIAALAVIISYLLFVQAGGKGVKTMLDPAKIFHSWLDKQVLAQNADRRY